MRDSGSVLLVWSRQLHAWSALRLYVSDSLLWRMLLDLRLTVLYFLLLLLLLLLHFRVQRDPRWIV